MNKEDLEKLKKGLDDILGGVVKDAEKKTEEIGNKKIGEAIEKLTKFFSEERKTLNEILTSKYLTEVSKAKSIDELCNKVDELIKKEGETKEIIVKNQIEIPKVEIPKFPEKIEVKNFPKSDSPIIVEAIKNLVSRLKAAISAFVSNKETTEAIPVRLVDKDGKYFYTAQFNTNLGGGVGIDLTKTENELEEIEDNTELASAPTIYNVSMTLADTEYSQVLPNNVRIIDVKLRALNALLKMAFTVNESGSNYVTIPFGASMHLDMVKLTGKTIYFQSPTANQVCEIVCWT